MSIRIITDSASDISQFEARQMGIDVLPLKTLFGTEEYRDGIDLSHEGFYHKLIESDVLPTTSQPTPFAFGEVFEEAVQAGDTVVCITVSSKLSGTYQSACIAAEDYPGKVFVVDGQTVAIGSGLLVEHALQLAAQGLSAQAIAEEIAEKRGKVHVLALVDTLEYLKKGGRISSAVAFAGGVLNIKPVITLTGGEIRMLGKARGSRQANNLLVQEIEKAGGVDFDKPLLLGYTGLSDALLRKYIDDSARLWEGYRKELPVCAVGSVVGTHVGPGAVAVAFFAAE